MARTSIAALVAGALMLLACQKQVPEQVGEVKPAVSAPATAKPSASAEPPKPPSQPGEWIESLRYKLRVLDVSPCEEPTPGVPFRLGVTVEVQATQEAKVSPVVASPAAATLEQGGKIFRASMKPLPSETCKALLVHQLLKPGESTQGVLVFEAPNDAYFRSSILAFQPPRWGGELRVEVKMPDCFGKSCPSAQEGGTGKPASSGAAPSGVPSARP